MVRYPKAYLNKYYFEIIFVIFLIIISVNTLNHEMWEDEWQAWLIAKYSSSLSSLFYNLRYEGHPALWYLCLYILNMFTEQPAAMQIFHLALCAAAMYIFLRLSPFTPLQKTLFVFGYFPLYEYSVIARNYGIGMLFLFAFCASFRYRDKNYFIPLALLVMLTQTNGYGLGIASVCGGIVIYEVFTNGGLQKATKEGRMGIYAGIAIFILAVFIAAYQILPPIQSWSWRHNPIYEIAPASVSGTVDPAALARNPALGRDPALGKVLDKIVRTSSGVWRGYIPIPEFTYHFWNSTIITTSGVKPVLSAILFLVSSLFLCKKPGALFIYSFGTFFLLVIEYKIGLGRLRHQGYLFMLMIAALWISNYYPDQESRFAKRIRGDFLPRYKNSFIILLLCCQIIAGIYASVMDWKYPFSESKEMANFIRDKGLDHMLTLAHRMYPTSSVCGYLNHEFYYLAYDRFGSFAIGHAKGWRRIKEEDILDIAERMSSERKSDLLLIVDLEYKLNDPKNRITLVKEFDKGIIPAENYVLYLMRHKSE